MHNQNVFPLRESNSIMSGNDPHLRTYSEVHSHSLNSDQAFLSIQLKTFPKSVDGLLNCFAFDLYPGLFHILTIKSSYRVDQALSNFLLNSFGIL